MGEERLFFIHVLLVMSVQETPSRPFAASVGILGHALHPFGDLLRAEGFAVSEIHDPNESGTFSLILMSLAHPDAVQWCERLCRRPSNPVVWAVADETNDEDAIRRALAAGASDVFGWPVSPAVLFHRLRHHLTPLQTQRETRFLEFFRQNPLPCAIFDLGAETRRYVEVNPAFAAATGFSREELIGRSLEEVGNFARGEALTRMRERLATNRVIVFESDFRLKSGKIRRASVAVGLADIEGRTFALVTLYDLERKMRVVEQARAETERRLVELTRVVPGIVCEYRVDAEGREAFTFINDVSGEIFGLTPDEILADPWILWNRIHPDEAAAVRQAFVEAHLALHPMQQECRVILPNGDIKWLVVTGSPRREGAATVWSGIFTDVTETRRLVGELEVDS